jgi:hypothetical protein
MYYTAALKSQPKLHCVSYATSKTVAGPYTDPSSQPWICPTAEGGAIDPAGYTNADGTRWVTYKIDGNAIGHGGECGTHRRHTSDAAASSTRRKNKDWKPCTDPGQRTQRWRLHRGANIDKAGRQIRPVLFAAMLYYHQVQSGVRNCRLDQGTLHKERTAIRYRYRWIGSPWCSGYCHQR